ncbi:Vacuolar fusion protein CCZ1 homolog [Coccomyxa sp. Obi]|nr:Vacuolar fusion protein CCZ1 homolog [Coccomyxa sp. Obi]
MTAPKRDQEKTVPPLQLCTFDVRRGRVEGQEADRVLGFYPSCTDAIDQVSVVGLVQAMSAFSSIFDQENSCESMHAERSVWIIHECEPSLWLLLVAQRIWFSGPVRDEALRETLKQLHAVGTLLHGPLQGLLDQDPSGGLAREALAGLMVQWGERLSSSKGALYQSLHNPLSGREGVPWLPLSRPLFTGVQALVSRLLVAQVGGAVPVQAALLMHEHWCLWSSLDRADTAALVRLASLTLLPAAHAAEQPSLGSRITSTLRWQEADRAARHVLDRKAWHLVPPGFLMLQPPPGMDAACAADLPQIWLQESGERCGLLGLRAGGCLLLLLLAERVAAGPDLCRSLAASALPSLTAIAHSTAAELSTANQWHIPSIRYVYMDDMLLAVRASPASKAATLSRDSQALVHSVRADLDAVALKGDSEVIVRGAHDCWVIAKRVACRSIAIVLEGRGQENLSDAANTADKYLRSHFEGLLE